MISKFIESDASGRPPFANTVKTMKYTMAIQGIDGDIYDCGDRSKAKFMHSEA